MRAALALAMLVALTAAPARASASAPAAIDAPTPSARTDAAFLGLGLVGSGALAIGAITFLGRSGSVAGGVVALPLAGLMHYGLGKLLGVPVSALGAGEGVLLGLATGAAGFGIATFAGTQLRLDTLSLGVIGLVVGAAIGTPLWTLLDPFGLSAPPSPPVGPVAARPSGALLPGVVLPVVAGRF